jgi:hypothetical protein
VGVAAWLVGCSTGPRIVDHAELEAGIMAQSPDSVRIASVSCPDDRVLRQGDTFTCGGTLDTGEPVTFVATQTDGDGDITFDRVEAVFPGADFAGPEGRLISVDYGITVTLVCPERIVVADGGTFTCQGTDDRGHTRTVTFTAVHPRDGEFTYVVDGLPPPSTTTTAPS